jgi:hypothetical protein
MAMNYSDEEIAKNIGEWSMWELAGTLSFYKDRAPNLYAILACHPSISPWQRKVAIESRGENIKETLMHVNRDSLNITIGLNGHSKTLPTQDFITIRDEVAKELGITTQQVA